MPPLPPIVDETDPSTFVEWLKNLAAGAYYLDVASSFTPQIAPEGAIVFQIGDKVFTVWPNARSAINEGFNSPDVEIPPEGWTLR